MNNLQKIATVLVLFDGLFHFFSLPIYLKRVSPDWIIADGLFDTVGLPAYIHRIMGIYLVSSSIYTLMNPDLQYSKLYIRYVVPLTLFIISTAVVIKVYNSLRL
jgi:hypothetical protein